MAPTVSVVIPTQDRANLLPLALSSALDQTLEGIEVIVVDDASEDATPAVLQGYDDPRLRVIRHDEPQGASAARNRGIDEARAPLVAFLDSDDTWEADKLERQVRRLRDLPDDYGVVYTGYWEVRDGERRLGQVPQASGDIRHKVLAGDPVSPTSCVLARTGLLREAGGFDEDLPARQDYDLWIRLADHAKFEPVTDPLVTLHDEGDRITADLEARLEGHDRVLEKLEPRIRELSPLEQRRVRAEHDFVKALHLHEHGATERARTHALRALRRNPTHARAWVLAGMLATGTPVDHPAVQAVRRRIQALRSASLPF
jgi:glycosyltransferase involved in cell wall biosynthesis